MFEAFPIEVSIATLTSAPKTSGYSKPSPFPPYSLVVSVSPSLSFFSCTPSASFFAFFTNLGTMSVTTVLSNAIIGLFVPPYYVSLFFATPFVHVTSVSMADMTWFHIQVTVFTPLLVFHCCHQQLSMLPHTWILALLPWCNKFMTFIIMHQLQGMYDGSITQPLSYVLTTVLLMHIGFELIMLLVSSCLLLYTRSL